MRSQGWSRRRIRRPFLVVDAGEQGECPVENVSGVLLGGTERDLSPEWWSLKLEDVCCFLLVGDHC